MPPKNYFWKYLRIVISVLTILGLRQTRHLIHSRTERQHGIFNALQLINCGVEIEPLLLNFLLYSLHERSHTVPRSQMDSIILFRPNYKNRLALRVLFLCTALEHKDTLGIRKQR